FTSVISSVLQSFPTRRSSVLEPARRAARMRQGDVRDAVHSAHVADSRFKRDLSPKTIDGETAEQKDHTRPQKGELLIEPWSAERSEEQTSELQSPYDLVCRLL